MGHSCRIKADHGPESKHAMPELALCHWHKPTSGKYFVITARAALLEYVEKRYPVKHQVPAVFAGHEHGMRAGVRFSRGPRGGMMQNLFDKSFSLHLRMIMLRHAGGVLVLVLGLLGIRL